MRGRRPSFEYRPDEAELTRLRREARSVRIRIYAARARAGVDLFEVPVVVVDEPKRRSGRR